MTGFTRVGDLVQAEIDGKSCYATWRKTPIQTTTIGIWFDLSMSPGNPQAQYYAAAPLEATPLLRSENGGLNHGQATGTTKVLRQISAMNGAATALPMTMMCLDYLLYYPFVDQGTTDQQDMDNTVTLPRHVSGAGVQVMAISVAAPIGGQTFRITYTNSDGVAGRVSGLSQINAATYVGAIATSDRAVALARGPFISLQDNDSGVRSIESVSMVSGTDVGLLTLVLVYPMAQFQIRGIDAAVEVDYFQDFSRLPIIEDDAYLNWICCPSGSLNGASIIGDMKTVWS